MAELVTFGEVQLRLATPNFNRIEQTTSFDASVGGAELNVAVTASRLGLATAIITRVPKNPLGRMVVNKAREQGVDTSHVLWSDSDRQGIYFLEFGALPRPSSIIYDRANSAISKIQPGMIDWDKAFSGAKAFHITGITPALSKSALAATEEALIKAKDKGLLVSFDLNYRAKLWTQEEAKTGLSPLMKFVDILITTEEDTGRVFGISGEDWTSVARALAGQFKFKVVAITLRETPSVWRNVWKGIALKSGIIYEDCAYETEVVDRVGSGDAFAGGFISTYLKNNGDVELALKYGNACGTFKHTNTTDLAWFTREEIETLVKGKGSLRITR